MYGVAEAPPSQDSACTAILPVQVLLPLLDGFIETRSRLPRCRLVPSHANHTSRLAAVMPIGPWIRTNGESALPSQERLYDATGGGEVFA